MTDKKHILQAFNLGILSKNWKLRVSIFLLFAILGLYFSIIAISNYIQLNNRGITVDGTVIEKSDRFTKIGRKYSVSYQFISQGNYNVKSRDNISKELYSSIKKGDNIPVIYLAENPRINNIEGEEGIAGDVYLLLGSLASLFIALYIFIYAIKKRKSKKHLLEKGLKAKATVTGVHFDYISQSILSIFIKRVYWRYLFYEFTDYRGQKHQGQAKYLLKETKREYMEGDEIEILYNSENPDESYWEKDINY